MLQKSKGWTIQFIMILIFVAILYLGSIVIADNWVDYEESGGCERNGYCTSGDNRWITQTWVAHKDRNNNAYGHDIIYKHIYTSWCNCALN